MSGSIISESPQFNILIESDYFTHIEQIRFILNLNRSDFLLRLYDLVRADYECLQCDVRDIV